MRISGGGHPSLSSSTGFWTNKKRPLNKNFSIREILINIQNFLRIDIFPKNIKLQPTPSRHSEQKVCEFYKDQHEVRRISDCTRFFAPCKDFLGARDPRAQNDVTAVEKGTLYGAMSADNRKNAITLLEGTSYSAMSANNRKCAFTLAEVLITLGIIGIVAAMTLPTLIQNLTDKASVTKVKKVYSILNQAYLLSKEENGAVSEWNIEEFSDLIKYFSPYIKNIRICTSDGAGCSPINTYDLTGQSYTNSIAYYHFIDANGFAYKFSGGYLSQAEANKYGGSFGYLGDSSMNRAYQVIVHIDGKKKILRWGINTFVFWITDKGIVPYGVIGWSKQQLCNPSVPSTAPGWWNGMGCAGWVISEGNMDYLKCLRGKQKYCERGNYNP